MRNLTIYLVVLLCLFVTKISAQETYEEASEKYEANQKEIIRDEERMFSEKVEKLKGEQKKGVISIKEFKEQKKVLENKKESNIKERVKLISDNLFQKFPEMGAKSFEDRVFWISTGIKKDIREEKDLLKKKVEMVDKQLIEGLITKKQAEEQKLKLAEFRAKTIEEKVKLRQEALKKLIQDDVEGKLPKHAGGRNRVRIPLMNAQNVNIGDHSDIVLPSMKAYNGQKDKDRQQNKRTSSQLVFAIGANNLVTDGAVANSDFKYAQSHFYEWGLTLNSRIFPNHNLLHAKYGFSLMYNDLRPTDNRYFVVNGNETDLMTNTIPQKDARFRNVNLVFPLHLEFDFTKPTVKDGKTYFKSHNSFRFGLGGYFGANLKSKQILEYDQNDYHRIEKTRGDYNVNTFIYGLSTYIGYKATSLYLKYDLNPLFKDNPVKQNNVSLGLRFDFN